MAPTDVLFVSLGSPGGLRAADAELLGALERAGARVAVATAAPQRDVRTMALTDFEWARAARGAAQGALRAHEPRAVLYSTTTAALLWPVPGAIRFDAPAAAKRPGRHGVWQRPGGRGRVGAAAPAAGGAAARAVGGGVARGDARAPRASGGRTDPGGAVRHRRRAHHRRDHVRRQPGEEGPRPRAGGVGNRATWRREPRRRRNRARAGRPRRGQSGAARARDIPRAPAPRARLRHGAAARGLRDRTARGARRRLRARDDPGARAVRGAAARARA